MNTYRTTTLRTARLTFLPVLAGILGVPASAHPQQQGASTGSAWTTVTPVTGGTAQSGTTVVAGGRTAYIAKAGDPDGSSRQVTVVTTTDNNHTIELKIDNGEMTVKCDGKDVPQSRVLKTDDGVKILDDQGNEVDVIKMHLGEHGAALFGGVNGAWSFGDPGSFTWAQAQPWTGMYSGTPPKVMLGISMSEPGPALEKHLGIKADDSVMISGLYKGLPADDAGLEQYDIIVKIDGKSPADRETIQKTLTDREPDDTVTLTVIHEGKIKDVKVRLSKYDADEMEKAEMIGEPADIWRMFDTDKFPGLYKRALVAPGNDFHEMYVAPMPQMDQVQEKIRKHLEGLNLHSSDTNQRLDDLNKRMEDLEKLLEKLVEKYDKGR